MAVQNKELVESLDQQVLVVANAAVAIIGKRGYHLDFSFESLEMVDARIEESRRSGETADSIPATMTALGIYVGEVLRRRLGCGAWVEDTHLGPWPMLQVGEVRANPIAKCMKRLDNGPEDSVRAFAELIVAMAEDGAASQAWLNSNSVAEVQGAGHDQ